jgi:DNA mismatch endonuclease (patch repair protein)
MTLLKRNVYVKLFDTLAVSHDMVTDVMTKEQRSRAMQAVRSKDTKLELTIRKQLWREGLRYRLKTKLVGNPDLVFPSARVVVFLDGCFWHGCPKCYSAPKSNARFWRDKLEANRKRDKFVVRELRKDGWTVLRFWSHSIKRNPTAVCHKIERTVHSTVGREA